MGQIKTSQLFQSYTAVRSGPQKVHFGILLEQDFDVLLLLCNHATPIKCSSGGCDGAGAGGY